MMKFHKGKVLCCAVLLSTSFSGSSYSMSPMLGELEAAAARTMYRGGLRFFSNYKIHPSIGIARVGNADDYYLAPKKIGGRPIEKDSGNFVSQFKNSNGEIRKQAAVFKIYDEDTGNEVPSSSIKAITWKVHLANKKAAWWEFNELCGNSMVSPAADSYDNTTGETISQSGNSNSYKDWAEKKEEMVSDQGIPVTTQVIVKRNSTEEDRSSLLVDYGFRSVSGGSVQNPTTEATFAKNSGIPYGYEIHYNKKPPTHGKAVKHLGSIKINDDYSLHVLGGDGKAGGNRDILGFAGADTWRDDISDGPVEAHVTFQNDTTLKLNAWVVVGAPKYAPELVNITTWSDTVEDMAVRNFGILNEAFDIENKKFILGQDGFHPSFTRRIKPIFDRMKNYNWVANVTPMVFFANPPFDITDSSPLNRDNRKNWFNQLRQTVDLGAEVNENMLFNQSRQQLFNNENDKFPLMPLGSGDNPVRNQNISKFLVLSPLQYYFLYQWSEGYFSLNDTDAFDKFNVLDQASIGNCVGYPMSPGIEVAWTVRNPILYDKYDPYRLKHRRLIDEYSCLDPERDETDPNNGEDSGLEPGDLTKRMAIPWQADFANCSVQDISYKEDPNKSITTTTQDKSQFSPITPAYQAYWWPAQAPWDVYTSNYSEPEQTGDNNPSGIKVNYQRGIDGDYRKIIKGWPSLGFILNTRNDELRNQYPNYVEKERNYSDFDTGSSTGSGPDLQTGPKRSSIEPKAVRIDAEVDRVFRRQVNYSLKEKSQKKLGSFRQYQYLLL